MDGNFVPTITFGDQMIRHIRPYTSLPLDCHLMVLRPETRLEGFARAGANMATIHVEECRENTVQMLRLIKNYGMKASAVINPNTPVESIFDAVGDADMLLLMSVHPGWGGQRFIESIFDAVGDADMLLLMSVHPGWGGQRFIPETLEKIERLRTFCICAGKPELDIEVDGGITEENVKDVISAGANVIVAGSTVFRSDDMKATIAKLRGE